MSTHQTPKINPLEVSNPIAVEINQPSTQSIAIRWKISRRALAAAEQTPLPVGQSPFIHLELRIKPTTSPNDQTQQAQQVQQASWILIDPQTHDECLATPSHPSHPSHTLAITKSALGLYIESSDTSCHLQTRDDQQYSLAYFRTTIFSRLGVPGGRYEPLGVTVNTDE